MSQLRERLLEEIARIPAVDAHTFVDPLRPTARDLEDFLSEPPYCGLLDATGVWRDRGGVEAALERLDNTRAHRWLLELSLDIFGPVEGEERAASIPALWRRAPERLASEGWDANLRYRMGIERLLVECPFDHPLEGFDPAVYVPALRADDLVFGLQDASVIERLREATRCDIGNAQGIGAAQSETAARFARRGARAALLSPPADFLPGKAPGAPPESILRRALSGASLTPQEAAEARSFAFWSLLERCLDSRLPIQLFLDEERPRAPRSPSSGGRLPRRGPGLEAFRDAFLAFPEVTFVVSTAGGAREEEVTAYAARLPNVVSMGRWSLQGDSAMAADLRARLEVIPRTKMIGYPTGASFLEAMLPQVRSHRRALANVLADDLVEGQGWSEERAVGLARTVLRDNADRIFFA